MNQELSSFAKCLRERIQQRDSFKDFAPLALELFKLQFKINGVYQRTCQLRGLKPKTVADWKSIPAMPAFAFKELDLTCLAPVERLAVFHSSGTTEQNPSQHFHCRESLELYEDSLWLWFEQNVLTNLKLEKHSTLRTPHSTIILTPPPKQAPHSSLVHMFETVRQNLNAPQSAFAGQINVDGAWTLDFDAMLAALKTPHSAPRTPQLILGTAFSFVHLLDFLVEQNLRFNLPAGSRVMETGGYKNRSRTMPKAELHALITERLGVPPENIICEYGMSELSSQAYDSEIHPPSSILHPRIFRFPPWVRAQIISPETGREVADGQTGLIRIFDLANVYSVAAIQTEDLGIRRGDGFELTGRARVAEPRGCSLMSHSAIRAPH